MTAVSVNDTDLLQISSLSSPSIRYFENHGVVSLLRDVFHSTIIKDLEMLYTQLYPNKVVARVSPFYVRSGHATLCNQVIGSTMNAASSNSSSVIMAYWPARGNDLSSIDYSRMRIRIVHYYCRHPVVFTVSGYTVHVVNTFWLTLVRNNGILMKNGLEYHQTVALNIIYVQLYPSPTNSFSR